MVDIIAPDSSGFHKEIYVRLEHVDINIAPTYPCYSMRPETINVARYIRQEPKIELDEEQKALERILLKYVPDEDYKKARAALYLLLAHENKERDKVARDMRFKRLSDYTAGLYAQLLDKDIIPVDYVPVTEAEIDEEYETQQRMVKP